MKKLLYQINNSKFIKSFDKMKLFSLVILFIFLFSSMNAIAQDNGLVPCGNVGQEDCGFNFLFDLIQNVINFIFKDMVIPLAAVMFAYAGFELVTSGGSSEKKSKAIKIFTHVAIGLAIAAGAFIIIQTGLQLVGVDKTWDWFGFNVTGKP